MIRLRPFLPLVRGAAAQASAVPGAVGQGQGCDVEIVDRTGKQARAADRALADFCETLARHCDGGARDRSYRRRRVGVP